MKITLKQNWKNKNKKDKVRALCTLSVGDIIGVSVSIIKSKKGYFLAFPSYYNEKKDKYNSYAFPMSKKARKIFDVLLKKFLKNGKKSCSIEIDEEHEFDDDYFKSKYEEYEAEDEAEDEDEDDFVDLPF